MPAVIDDTYAEAFRSIYAEFLITARDKRWVEHAVAAATGNASSTIMCDCEAGLDRYVGPEGRRIIHDAGWSPGCDCTTACSPISEGSCPGTGTVSTRPDLPERADLSDDGVLQSHRLTRILSHGPQGRLFRGWISEANRAIRSQDVVDSTLGGEFILDRRLGYADGLMGGNLWYMGETEDAAWLRRRRVWRPCTIVRV